MQCLAKNKKLLELGPSPVFLLKKTCIACSQQNVFPRK